MKKILYHFLSFLLVVFFLTIAFGSKNTEKDSAKNESKNETSSKSKDEDEKSADIIVTAEKYYSDYNANEVSADNKYKGKTIQITGVVTEIGKSWGIYINLSGNDFLGEVRCKLEKGESNKASDISKGQKITLVGKGDGKIFFPQLDDCVFK